MVKPLVRKAIEADIPKLLPLMRELAVFEKYDHAFAITEAVLREQGFRRSPPDFECFVAEQDGELLGIAVYYFVPFTFRAKPNMVVKELYVSEAHRSKGVGELLMKAVSTEAVRTGCAMIKWWVAKWNDESMRFYERLGARIDPEWIEFHLSEEGFRKLAASGPK